jgi:hypothetical protein
MYLAHLEKLSRTRIEDVLVEEGILERPRVEEAQAEQERTGRQLGDILIEREIVSDYDFAKLVCSHYSLPFLDVSHYSTRRDVLELLPADFCQKHAVLPLDVFGTTLTLAICEMPSQELVEEIVAKTNLTPFLFVAVRRNLLELLLEQSKRGGKKAKSEAAAPQVDAVTLVEQAPADPTTEEVPLPDLDLPLVSMKLLDNPSKVPPAPVRGRTAPEPKPKTGPVAPAPGAALSWMDGATKSGAARPLAVTEPGSPKIDKFAFKGNGSSAPPARPASPAAGNGNGHAAPPPENGKPAKAWQSIFEKGEESVKKDKTL